MWQTRIRSVIALKQGIVEVPENKMAFFHQHRESLYRGRFFYILTTALRFKVVGEVIETVSDESVAMSAISHFKSKVSCQIG